LLLPILDRHPEMPGNLRVPDVAAQRGISPLRRAARCGAVEGDARITVPPARTPTL
jgi:hypothetical protein